MNAKITARILARVKPTNIRTMFLWIDRVVRARRNANPARFNRAIEVSGLLADAM